jgi:hypothetical protein
MRETRLEPGRLTRFTTLFALVAATAMAPPAGAKSAARAAEFDWSGRLGRGKHIEIKGVNGSIVAEPSQSGEVEVHAVKRGRRSDPDDVKIEVIEHAEGVTLCAVYPTPWGSPPNECKPGGGGRMNTRNNDVSVDFTVRVPAGVGFVGRTVNGAVKALSLGGEVEAKTVNGNVHVSTTQSAEASTVNGSIVATLGSMGSSESLEFRTVNGRITVELPETAGAAVSAETVNGDIATDFPLTVKGRFSARKISGTIGKGGPELILRTVNGSIRLRSVPRSES